MSATEHNVSDPDGSRRAARIAERDAGAGLTPAERYALKIPAMDAAELVAAHARIAAQARVLELSHPLWESTAKVQELLAAELLRRLEAVSS